MVQNRLAGAPGFVGIASELVRYPEQVQTVIQNLLGVTILAADLTSANQLAKLVNYQYRVVSLEGDVMNPGGSMTGEPINVATKEAYFHKRKNFKQLLNK